MMNSMVLPVINETSPPRRSDPLPGLPDLDYPAPLIVRHTFIDTEVDRPASLIDFWTDRNIQSCPPGRIAAMSFEDECPKSGDATMLHEGEATARSRSTSVGSTASELSSAMPCKTAELAEDVAHPDMEAATAGRDGALWPLGIPRPPCEPPLVSSPSLPEPDAPPVPRHAATATLRPTVPVLLLSDAIGAFQESSSWPKAVSQPVPGTPQLPSVGSAGHAAGTCKPCAYFAHSRGCANGVQCPFCHLCPPGELKRRQKEMRHAKSFTQQSSWHAVDAYRRRRDTAGRGKA